MQVFYITHVLGFVLFMAFAFIHYQSMWAYTLPGMSSSVLRHRLPLPIPPLLTTATAAAATKFTTTTTSIITIAAAAAAAAARRLYCDHAVYGCMQKIWHVCTSFFKDCLCNLYAKCNAQQLCNCIMDEWNEYNMHRVFGKNLQVSVCMHGLHYTFARCLYKGTMVAHKVAQGMWLCLCMSVCVCAGFVLYLMDVTFRIAQWMHTVPASPASKVSQDGMLATLAFRWSHVRPLAFQSCLSSVGACLPQWTLSFSAAQCLLGFWLFSWWCRTLYCPFAGTMP